MSAPAEVEADLLEAFEGLKERMAKDMRPELLEGVRQVLPVLDRAISEASNSDPTILPPAAFLQSQLRGVVENPEPFSDALILTLIIGAGEALKSLQPQA